jgi:hypothetical protein
VELAKHASAVVGICAEDLGWKLCTSSEAKLCKIKWITYTGQGADENVLSVFAFPRKANRVMINRFPGKDRLHQDGNVQFTSFKVTSSSDFVTFRNGEARHQNHSKVECPFLLLD